MPPEGQQTPSPKIKWNEVTWYSKLGAAILFLGIVPVLSFHIGIQYALTVQQLNKDIAPQTTSFNEDNKNTFESEGINPEDEQAFNNTTSIIFTNSEGVEISFAGTIVEARNPGSHVLLNKQEIGTVQGHGIVEANFSADDQRFIFSVMTICGATCVDKYNYEINIPSATLTLIR